MLSLRLLPDVRGAVVERVVEVSSSSDSATVTASREQDRARLRLIVEAFLACRELPAVALVARQFRYETGRVADADEVERAIERTTA
jgi:hypothetical protein